MDYGPRTIDKKIGFQMFLIYDAIFILFALIYLPIFLIKKKWHKDFFARFGFLDEKCFDKLKDSRPIWIHAVSVGEAKAAQPLLNRLRGAFPDKKFVLSTVTKTGNKVAKKIVLPQDLLIYLPMDLSFAVRKFLDAINPCCFIIVETELWPNLILELSERKIPIVVVNGRISKRSLKGYSILRPLFKHTLSKVNLFCMQTNKDAESIVGLGAPVERVRVVGSVKFDIATHGASEKTREEIQVFSKILGISPYSQLIVAGSTHKPEEELILRIYKILFAQYSRLRLLIAPRHIERSPNIERLVRNFGLEPALFSKLSSQKPADDKVIILDTLGQLNLIYSFATIVFVGGSMVDKGGHNLIEPAVFSKPIIFGPYMSNFQDIAQLFVEKEAAMQVKDEKHLFEACADLLRNPGLRNELGQKARQMVESSKGATERHTQLIRNLMSAPGADIGAKEDE